MQSLPTVLLRHTTREGSHYDWLLADPCDPAGKLWTARCPWPSEHWLGVGRFALQPIQPHRRAYLTYQGPISGGRGSVLRIDEGTFVPRLWTSSRIIIDLHLKRCQAMIELARLEMTTNAATGWRASVQALASEADEPREIGLPASISPHCQRPWQPHQHSAKVAR